MAYFLNRSRSPYNLGISKEQKFKGNEIFFYNSIAMNYLKYEREHENKSLIKHFNNLSDKKQSKHTEQRRN